MTFKIYNNLTTSFGGRVRGILDGHEKPTVSPRHSQIAFYTDDNTRHVIEHPAYISQSRS